MVAFLIPVVTTAVVVLVRSIQGVSEQNNQLNNAVPQHPLSNFFLGIVSYFSVAAVVPLALLLLARTGQKPASIGTASHAGEPTSGPHSVWWDCPIWPNTP